MKKNGAINNILPISLLPMFVIGVYYIFSSSLLVRYWADDFCFGVITNKMDFFLAQSFWWTSWSGRYSFNALMTLFGIFGQGIVRILPLIVLSTLFFLVFKILKNWMGMIVIPSISRFFLSSLFLLVIFTNSPNIIQTLYWQSGMTNYLIPFVFLGLFLLLFSSSVFLKSTIFTDRRWLLAFVFTFIAGGFSETYVLVQCVLLVYLLVVSLFIYRLDQRNCTSILWFGLFGSLASLVLMISSPGNSIRESTVTHPESISYVITSSLYGAKWLILRLFQINSFTHSLLVFATSIFITVFINVKSKMVKELSLIKLFAVLLISVVFMITSVFVDVFSGFYSMSTLPPSRALFVAYVAIYFFLLIILVILSLLVFKLLSENGLIVTLVILVVINIIESYLFTRDLLRNFSIAKTEIADYSRKWDLLEPKLSVSRGEEYIKANNIKPVGELDDFLDNKGWIGSCISEYYGIEKIEWIK